MVLLFRFHIGKDVKNSLEVRQYFQPNDHSIGCDFKQLCSLTSVFVEQHRIILCWLYFEKWFICIHLGRFFSVFNIFVCIYGEFEMTSPSRHSPVDIFKYLLSYKKSSKRLQLIFVKVWVFNILSSWIQKDICHNLRLFEIFQFNSRRT